MYVRIDRTRKVTVTTFLRALGLSSDEDIISVFGDNVISKIHWKKIQLIIQMKLYLKFMKS